MSKMPVVFIAHGSPMNAIESNPFTVMWETLGAKFPKPKAILSISAHWYIAGTSISDTEAPRMIYDMYGFPKELYQVNYPAGGSPALARRVQTLLGASVSIDNSWGLDHGTWSVLSRIYPGADIPVVQLSIHSGCSAQEHYAIGAALSPLREEGVLILGSGNIVHNLAKINWQMEYDGTAWAKEFDNYIKQRIFAKDWDAVMHYEQSVPSVRNAFHTPEHYDPLLYVLGAAGIHAEPELLCEGFSYGSLSMTSYLFR